MRKYLISSFKEYILIILTATIFFLLTFKNVKAEENVFIVDNVKIEIETNVNFSREKYINIALKDSFEILMSKIVLSKDLGDVDNVDLKKIKNLISSFQIEDEIYRNNKYEAKFNIFYNEIKVKKFLSKKNISFSDPKKISAIFFPLLIINNEIIEFDQNFFYKEWLNVNIKNESINFLLPLEDLEDISKISKIKNRIEEINVEDFVNKYDVKNYVFAMMSYENNKINIYLTINFNKNKISKNTFYKINDINDEKELASILKDLKLLITDLWKKENIINLATPLTLKINYKHKKLKELDDLKNIFYKISIIENYSLDEFSTKNSIIKIYYYGNPKKLRNELAQYKYKLKNNDGKWELYKDE